jgi:predicted transcriptional regulator
MAEKETSPIKVLRDRHGGMSDELKEYFKNQNQIRKKLKDSLKGGAKTIPEIARDTGLDSPDVVWHVMAMKRYGEVAEVEKKGDYYTYKYMEAAS